MIVATNNTTNQQKSIGQGWQVALTPKRIGGFLVIQALLLTGCALITYQQWLIPDTTVKNINDKRANVKQQAHLVNQLKTGTQLQLGLLAQRMGTLTARMNRIDALGERLAQDAQFSEFDFTLLPAVGGPSEQHEVSEKSSLSVLLNQMDNVLLHLEQQQDQLAVLETVMLNHSIDEDSRIEGRPIKRGWMSSQYGMRNDPFGGKLAMHKGVDFAGSEGGDVMATGAGVVSWASERSGYGLLVEIDHGGGLKTRYGHAKKILVALGDVVTKGEVIALIGNTGRSTGPHVHYEVLAKDRQVNPRKYIYR